MKIVDMQVLLPKVNEVSRVQQISQHENDRKQAEFNTQLAQQTVKAETSVNKTAHNEQPLVKEKQEREKKRQNDTEKEGNNEHKENKEKEVETGMKSQASDSRGSKLDIMA